MNEAANESGVPEQMNKVPPSPTQADRIEYGLKNLMLIHERDTIVEMVCIAIVKSAPVPVVMAAASNIERSALLARFAADGLTSAAVGNLIPEADHAE